MGTWSFLARSGGNHARARRHSCLPRPGTVPVPERGRGRVWMVLGLVLFGPGGRVAGLRVIGFEHKSMPLTRAPGRGTGTPDLYTWRGHKSVPTQPGLLEGERACPTRTPGGEWFYEPFQTVRTEPLPMVLYELLPSVWIRNVCQLPSSQAL